jgi:hypothetical protein
MPHSDRAVTHQDFSDDDGSNADASDDDVQASNRAPRHSKGLNDPKPSQLRHYSGPWVDVLVDAKHSYRLFIHTDDPFPERNSDSLNDAHNCLLEAIGKYVEEQNGTLDEGWLLFHF